MRNRSREIIAVLSTTAWIGLSEFLRNQLWLLQIWVNHYHTLGLSFPAAAVNGVVWMMWSFCFAVVIFVVSRRFGFWATAALAWVFGFVMMWLVIGNLGVLPWGLLWAAVPLSMLEALCATLITQRVAPRRT